MKNIKHFDFFRTKYGEELLIDIVELKHIKKYFANNPFHSLGYYDVTLVIEGEGEFRIDSKGYHAKPGDVLFSCPRHIRAWNTEKISNGYALIFEGEFLLNFFNDRNFLKDISYFNCNFENKNKLSLNNEDYTRIANLIFDIKREIDMSPFSSEMLIKVKHGYCLTRIVSKSLTGSLCRILVC